MFVCSSIDEALILTQKEEMRKKIERIFVIGGGQIYKKSISLPECEKLYLTKVDTDVECDAFFPEIPDVFKKIVHAHILCLYRKAEIYLKKMV